MRLITLDPLRTLDVPGTRPLKPEQMFRESELIKSADWVLFPEYWQVNALVYAWKKKIFPSINTYHMGHDKVELSRALQALCPGNVPQTLILPRTPSSEEVILDQLCFPMVAKEVRNSMGLGVYLIEERSDLRRYIQGNDILYLQEYLPITRDLRVVVIGRQVIAAYWRNNAPGQFHSNVARGGHVSFEDIPTGALQLVETVANALGINHAGFDIVELHGHYYILEFNVRFGTQALNERGIKTGPWIMKYLQEEQYIPPITPDSGVLPKAS